jgi:uncharacterized membrane protein
MDVRNGITATGAGGTTFLLVAVLVIELLDTEFSAILGLPVGLIAGIAVFAGLWVAIDEMRSGIRRAASAYAAFGLAVLGLLALRYVNVGRDVLTTDVVVGVSLAVVVVVYVALFLYERTPA